MGVPVITLAGKVHAARAGLSLLTALELGELVPLTRVSMSRTQQRWPMIGKGLSTCVQTCANAGEPLRSVICRHLRGRSKKLTEECGAIGARKRPEIMHLHGLCIRLTAPVDRIAS